MNTPNRSAPRYLLCPGYVMSKNDGQRHYVSATALASLYGVLMGDCNVKSGFDWRPQNKLIELHPRYDGDYSLPVPPDAGAKL